VNSGAGDQLKDCMVVFDDVDTISNERIRRAVWKLRRDLLQTGRHGSVYVINTGYTDSDLRAVERDAFRPQIMRCPFCPPVPAGHEYRAHDQTKAANKESTAVIMFPDGESYGVKDYCKTYGGMNKQQIDRIFKMANQPHSWICLSRRSPRHILHNHGGYFLDSGADEVARPSKKRKRPMFDSEL
jgi:hypothetical protein